jgi:flagellin
VQSVQTATNALAVADGALATIGTLLQRIRTLVVAANSTLESSSDIADDQAEINSLAAEIDHVSATTQFNGKTLLDGSLSSDTPKQAQLLIPVNDQTSSGDTLISTAPGFTAVVNSYSPAFVQQLTVDSYDTTTGQLTLTVNIESTDPSFGAQQLDTVAVQSGTNYYVGDPQGPPTPGNPTFAQSADSGFGQQVLSFNIATLSPSDVGKTSLLVSIEAQTKAPGQNAQVNDGSAEGTIVSIDIPAVNAQNLAVNGITLSPTGDSLINEAAEYRVDYGIGQLATIRAQIGSQIVSLQADTSTNANTAVQLQSSESSIADLNVGQAVTQLTLDQIRSSIETAVMAKLYSAAPAVLALVQGDLQGPSTSSTAS